MARLLRNSDYSKYIQDENLLQVIEDNWTLAQDVEQAAQAEMYGYLAQRYITNNIFTNTSVFDITATYYGKNLVYLSAPPYNPASTYIINSLTVFNGSVYYCPAAITVPESFDVTNWTLLGPDQALYYVGLPNPEFDYFNTYVASDVVWFNNKTYTAKSTIKGILPTNGQFWIEGAIYSISGIDTQDPKWTLGDNRNQLIVMRLIDVTLFHIHSRINPRNIPDLRKERYDGNSPAQLGGAIGWLKQISHGVVNVDLPEILPTENLSINWGNAGGSDLFQQNTI